MNYTSKRQYGARNVALYGLFTALIYVATRFIEIHGPTPGGLFHLGNVMAFTIAIVFGRNAGAVSAALGMALYDLTSPYFIWAPFTFVIRFAMGYILGYMAFLYKENNNKSLIFTLLGIIISTVIMILGYYLAEVVLYGNFIVPLQSVWGNFMQCVIGTVLGLPLAAALRVGFRQRYINTQI